MEYENVQECSFEADIKIHGGHSDHVSNSELISSMRVRLKEGNILKRKYFTLFLPEARNDENEIFISTLLQKLDFLSGDNIFGEILLNTFCISIFLVFTVGLDI